uniref:NADH-ubiquinone oxidoreductase chain 2 n=1 Tax=Trisidos kiyonoi TaxID=935009 RepID=A0A1U9ALR2_TRIKY|nr:NADH dehydrogenase subunit 2 [Trisidos kiyonoi]
MMGRHYSVRFGVSEFSGLVQPTGLKKLEKLGGFDTIKCREPWSNIFSVGMVLSVVFSVSSTDLFMAWFGLEVGVFSFLGYMGCGKSDSSGSGASVIKYALPQGLGSIVLLFGILISFLDFIAVSFMNSFGSILVCSGLLIKLGLPPFHMWYARTVAEMDWWEIFFLSTVQKISPLVIFSCMDEEHYFLSLFAGFGSIISGIGGIMQVSVRGVVSYSSIGHVCWGVLAGCLGMMELIVYLLVCTFSMFFFCGYFEMNGVRFFKAMVDSPSVEDFDWMAVSVLLFSLAGLPPFVGFVVKLFVLVESVSIFPLSVAMMVLGSVIHLCYYLEASFWGMIMSTVPGSSWMSSEGLGKKDFLGQWSFFCVVSHSVGGVVLLMWWIMDLIVC